MNDAEFMQFQKLIYNTCGINLSLNKKQLLVSRLRKRVEALNLKSFRAYREHVIAAGNEQEFSQMLNAVSTNKTDFYREPIHFDFLKQTVFPKIKNQSQIRIWCAASSSGEEPYTLAITLAEALGTTNKDVKILATDISTKVLEEAEKAIYTEEVVQPIPKHILKKYFLKGHNEWDNQYLVKDELRKWVHFKRLNLTEPLPLSIEFDYIFCRNVMIYFDQKTRENLVCRMEPHLKRGGYLFIGNAESLSGLTHPYKYIQPSVYQRKRKKV